MIILFFWFLIKSARPITAHFPPEQTQILLLHHSPQRPSGITPFGLMECSFSLNFSSKKVSPETFSSLKQELLYYQRVNSWCGKLLLLPGWNLKAFSLWICPLEYFGVCWMHPTPRALRTVWDPTSCLAWGSGGTGKPCNICPKVIFSRCIW